jgi:hypothetical protein
MELEDGQILEWDTLPVVREGKHRSRVHEYSPTECHCTSPLKKPLIELTQYHGQTFPSVWMQNQRRTRPGEEIDKAVDQIEMVTSQLLEREQTVETVV